MNDHTKFGGQFVQLDLPETHAATVTPAAIGGDQKFGGAWVEWLTHLLPPVANSRHGEFRRVVVDPNAHPPLVVREVIHSVRDDLPEVLVCEVVDFDPFRTSLLLPVEDP